MSLPLVPDANHPAFPTRSQADDWEIKRPAILDSAEKMAVIGQRCAQATPSKELIPTSRIGADPYATQNIASKPARKQERAARPTRRVGHAERTRGHVPKKKHSGRPKRRSAENNKSARASAWTWRNIYNIKANIIIIIITGNMETIQIQEINQNGKTKPDLDYAGVTPLSSRDRA